MFRQTGTKGFKMKKLFFSSLTNVFSLFQVSFSLETNLWIYRIGQVVWGFLYRNVFFFLKSIQSGAHSSVTRCNPKSCSHVSHLWIGYIKVIHSSKMSIFESVLKEHKLSTSKILFFIKAPYWCFFTSNSAQIKKNMSKYVHLNPA